MNLKRHFTRPDGEQVEDQREQRLNFGDMVDRAIVYLMAGLIGWLCLNTLAMREQIAVLVERGSHEQKRLDQIDHEIQSLRISDKYFATEMQVQREELIKHGWNPKAISRE